MTGAPRSRWAWGVGSLVCLFGATAVALHHPLSCAIATAAFWAWFATALRWPRLWLFAVPALLPAANLSPWTGWLVVEELDLLVLGAAAAGYARLALGRAEPAPPRDRTITALWVALAALALFGVWRGMADNEALDFGWFDGYTDPLNSLRVGKSALHALLLLPLLRRQWHADGAGAMRRFALGMLFGMVIVSLAVIWERAAYPGLLDFTESYRTTALFWEMHVGGAAIDVYVALGTPFVAWALWSARSRWQWAAAAVLAVVWCYVCLTTFSRGVYLAVALSGVLLVLLVSASGARWWLLIRYALLCSGAAASLWLMLDRVGYLGGLLAWLLAGGGLWLLHGRRGPQLPVHALAGAMLVLTLIFETVAVLGAGSFMAERLERSRLDYGSRLAHWASGAGLLHTPGEWLWGLGVGRLPANYDRFVLGGEFGGRVRLLDAPGGAASVMVAGPKSRHELGGLYALAQRVALAAAYRVSFSAAADRDTQLWVRVCESHLLYDRACQHGLIDVPGTQAWRRYSLPLSGRPLTRGNWFAPRQAVLKLSVFNAGGRVELDDIALVSGEGTPLLSNGGFSQAMAHWMPAAQHYFVPWHIDNLYLELLIERGVVGLVVFLALAAVALHRLLLQPPDTGAPFLAASLCAVLCVGLVSSVLDVARTALLLWLLLAVALQFPRHPGKRGAASGA